MSVVFADTAYFIALTNLRDAAHHKATAFADEAINDIVTTQWVLTEYCSYMNKPATRRIAGPFIEDLMRDPAIAVLPANAKDFGRGFRLYRDRTDKAWTLVDCISFILMRELRIKEALTSDHHFEQTGFTALLR